MSDMVLNDTTLVCVDCRDANYAIKVLDHCKSLCEFTDVKLLTNAPVDYIHKVEIQNISSLIQYSIFMLKSIHKYIDTKYFLVVQHDGWILNPQSWDNKWFEYDYIGPLFNQYDNPPIMGVGGFSFRSKALSEAVSKKYPEWDGTAEDAERLQKIVGGYYEDGAIAIALRPQLEAEGFKFATLEDAAMFGAGGNPNPDYHRPHPFGTHGSWRSVNIETGRVDAAIKHDGKLQVL